MLLFLLGFHIRPIILNSLSYYQPCSFASNTSVPAHRTGLEIREAVPPKSVAPTVHTEAWRMPTNTFPGIMQFHATFDVGFYLKGIFDSLVNIYVNDA